MGVKKTKKRCKKRTFICFNFGHQDNLGNEENEEYDTYKWEIAAALICVGLVIHSIVAYFLDF